MKAEVRAWLITSGFPDDIHLSAMHRGLGSTELWSFSPSPTGSPLVVRLFGQGADADAEREFLAMDTAAQHGLPVPSILMRGTLSHRSLLVTTFAPGTLGMELLTTHPAQAHGIGEALGEILGRLHQIAAPEGLTVRVDAWIARGGPALSPIRHLLEAVPRPDRLLHLDYHPNNVLLHDGQVTGIIDWENTLAGPPHMDVARTRALLQAITLGDLVPTAAHEAFVQFEQGLVVAHSSVIGPDPDPDLSAAWGLAMTVDDLTRQLAKPGVWVTERMVEQLAARRDRLIQSLLNSPR